MSLVTGCSRDAVKATDLSEIYLASSCMLPTPRGGRGTTLQGDRQQHGAEQAGLQGAEELRVYSDSSGNASTLSHCYAGKYSSGKQKYSGKYSSRRFLKLWMKTKYVQSLSSYVSRNTSKLEILVRCLLYRHI